MPKISYIRRNERVTVDHENKTVTVEDRFSSGWSRDVEYSSFVAVKDNFRDNNSPYMIQDEEGQYIAQPFCAETEQDKINHRIFADSKK